MSNPLFDDPRFPDRPKHPDYWRLVSATNYLDGEATEGGRTAQEVASHLIDLESLTYMAVNRARMARQQPGMREVPEWALASMWMDAFCAGVRFEKEGGKRTVD